MILYRKSPGHYSDILAHEPSPVNAIAKNYAFGVHLLISFSSRTVSIDTIAKN